MASVRLPGFGKSDLDATALFSQQIWCWGQDIVRPEGNWLLDVGFERIEPPVDRADSPSIYQLEPAPGRCLVLRGFGVFYGDQVHGGVFLPRYRFEPRYTSQPRLRNLPWTTADLPDMRRPAPSEQTAADALVSDLTAWIHRYEQRIADQLGVGYRKASLTKWKDKEPSSLSAEDMPKAWAALSLAFTETRRIAV